MFATHLVALTANMYHFRECKEQPMSPIRLTMSAVTSVARSWEQEEDFADALYG